MSASEGLNRIADAVFACAKEWRQQNKLEVLSLKLTARSVICSEGLYALGKLNMGVSQALEKKLLREGELHVGSPDSG